MENFVFPDDISMQYKMHEMWNYFIHKMCFALIET